jgi:hypothetical protein
MDMVPFLSAVIVVATIATIILAIFSYAAFKVRNRRRPAKMEERPEFFRRFEFGDKRAEDGEGAA